LPGIAHIVVVVDIQHIEILITLIAHLLIAWYPRKNAIFETNIDENPRGDNLFYTMTQFVIKLFQFAS